MEMGRRNLTQHTQTLVGGGSGAVSWWSATSSQYTTLGRGIRIIPTGRSRVAVPSAQETTRRPPAPRLFQEHREGGRHGDELGPHGSCSNGNAVEALVCWNTFFSSWPPANGGAASDAQVDFEWSSPTSCLSEKSKNCDTENDLSMGSRASIWGIAVSYPESEEEVDGSQNSME
ncbi:hypothetical protein HWV62_30218 [Athelia sp. TMB]|nr:hypothetical protein HWV62_30218 [Athelia sp. TMB]